MSYEYSEDGLIERATQDVLEELGWKVVTAWPSETFGPNGQLGREDKSQVLLHRDIKHAIQKYNDDIPDIAVQQAIDALSARIAGQDPGRINKDKYQLLKQGVPVSYTDDKGDLVQQKVKLFDFRNPENNTFLAVRQLEIVGDMYLRRPDVICFVNGIPLVFIELKNHNIGLINAYIDNLKDYKDTIPHVFDHNAFVILSNGREARVGTAYAQYKYFLEWKRIEEDDEPEVELDAMLRGTCDPVKLMDIFENFLLYDDTGGAVNKLMAKNHQYIGVNKVIDSIQHIDELEGKLGVFWHTQGSGKSYSMVFLCEKIHRKMGGSYTFLIVVDRTELENQIYDTFSGVGVVNSKQVVAGKKKGISGREHLRELLSDNHRYVFSLIHKFSVDPAIESEYPLITDRKNVIVISDEAHRTQSGVYAQNMRYYGLPNASYLGFTGTPIIKEEEELTKNIFGDYVSVYDFKRAIEDDATLPLRYINKGEKLKLNNPDIDDQMAAIIENSDLDEDQRQKLAYNFKKDYVVLTSMPRLDAIAKDLVWHFNDRGYQGKAMYVALDKPAAVKMYDLIQKYWPQYVDELIDKIKNTKDPHEEILLQKKLEKVKATEVCVVVSSEQNEVDKFRKLGLDIETHRKKHAERDLEKEFKDEDNPFRLAIVCAMWITGFDAPCVSTVYLDKPIKGHTLMQTIARANRIHDDEKENGLIVDYGNVYRQLEKAFSIYGEGGKGQGGRKSDRPVELLESMGAELFESIKALMLYLEELKFNLKDLMDAKPMQKIARLNDAINAICLNEASRTQFGIMARQVFKKYKALFPEPQAKRYTRKYNAINAIYNQLNENVKSADITEIIAQLQSVVDDRIEVQTNIVKEGNGAVDLSKLDFTKLKEMFSKAPRKNKLTYDLQQAVEQKLEQMLRENPLRMEFYARYQEIIKEYNDGKTKESTQGAFDGLVDLVKDLTVEERRAIKENLGNQEVLAIYDLLVSEKKLSAAEVKEVKRIAKQTLNTLKKEKLKVKLWRESQQVKAQVKSTIYNNLLWLPQNSYDDNDVGERTAVVYQHIYANYPDGGVSVYSGMS